MSLLLYKKRYGPFSWGTSITYTQQIENVKPTALSLQYENKCRKVNNSGHYMQSAFAGWGNQGLNWQWNENDQFQWHTVIMGYRWTGIMVSGCLNRGSTVGKLDSDHLANYPRTAVGARKETAWTPTKNFPKPHHYRPEKMTMFRSIHHFSHRNRESCAGITARLWQRISAPPETYLGHHEMSQKCSSQLSFHKHLIVKLIDVPTFEVTGIFIYQQYCFCYFCLKESKDFWASSALCVLVNMLSLYCSWTDDLNWKPLSLAHFRRI